MAEVNTCTVEELAEEAGITVQLLNKAFCIEHACRLAEFCDPWESIGYHLQLTSSNISAIKNDNNTTEMMRIDTLKKWKEMFAHRATYRILIEALIESKRAQQALEVCRKLKQESLVTEQSEIAAHSPSDSHDTVNEEFICDNVEDSICRLQERYIYIQNRFLKSGPEPGVTLEQLQTCVSTLPSFTTKTPQVLLEASSVNRFMHNLKEYCCALNPDILKGLISVLGDADTKLMMEQYTRDLHDFQHRTKLKDFVGNYTGPTPPEYKEVEMKLGDNWREKTLADVMQLNSQISRNSWLVKMVSERSICVTFMIPKEDELVIGIHLGEYLQTQDVLQICVHGLCIFKYNGIIVCVFIEGLLVDQWT